MSTLAPLRERVSALGRPGSTDMDPRLLRHYNQELAHLREMGAEFAQQFPKIAARLGIDGIEVSDPYVERLFEGFAFLAGRVQLKLEAEFPRFTQRLLDIVYPQFLAPTPSMLIAQFKPDLNDPGLAGGVTLPRGSRMHSLLGKGDETACEFRTAQAVELLLQTDVDLESGHVKVKDLTR